MVFKWLVFHLFYNNYFSSLKYQKAFNNLKKKTDKALMKINNFLIVTTLFCSFACVQTSKKVNETDASATAADEDPVAPTLVAGVDSLINHLWHLKNTSYANADINLGTLHQTTTGKDVVVAVSDSNMELTHEDLYFNSSKNLSRNYTLDSANWYGKYPTTSKNTEFHGTSVSGLIAATANNTVGWNWRGPRSYACGI